jgi:phage N-6-adenine-methyltransferase
MNAPTSIDHAFHEYANLFPMLSGEALNALREDIRAHGVREPVIFLDGAILDGRNRYQCARDLGIDFPRRDYDGDDALAFVISHNLHRRHLTESQRASVAARVANMKVGNPTLNRANLHDCSPQLFAVERPARPAPMVSAADAAEMLNVSERSVKTARKVHESAPVEVVRAVDDGRLSVSLAAKVVDLPDEAKAEIVAAPPEEIKEVAREAVKKAFVAHNTGNNEWYTPAAIIEAARAVLGGFDLDPATSEIANRTVQAARYFTAQDDGLAQEWPVGRIWMNPPYAQPLMGQFAEKFAAEIRRGSSGIVLVNNATETAWFQEFMSVASAVCFHRSRIRYVTPDGELGGAPLQGQAIIYCGSDPASFAERFGGFGAILYARGQA